MVNPNHEDKNEDDEPVGEFIPITEKEKWMVKNNLTEEQYNKDIESGMLPKPMDQSHLQPIQEKRLRHLYTQLQANSERSEQIDNRQMDDYKAHVMLVFNLKTDEEYKEWVLEGNIIPPELRLKGIGLTTYGNRVRHALGLTWDQWKQKVRSGELRFRPMGTGNYEDEDPQAKF